MYGKILLSILIHIIRQYCSPSWGKMYSKVMPFLAVTSLKSLQCSDIFQFVYKILYMISNEQYYLRRFVF